jgi:hypothetical protein
VISADYLYHENSFVNIASQKYSLGGRKVSGFGQISGAAQR